MIAVQDDFGEIIIPYSINLGGVLFDIFNELGIVFLPFLALYVMIFFEARSQGADEGSPGPLMIMNIETRFWSAAVVMILCTIPWSGAQTVSNITYVCGYAQTNTAMGDLYKSRARLNDTKTLQSISDVEMPLLLGLFNNVSVGSAETHSSQLECNKSQSVIESEFNKDFIPLNDEPLIANIKDFANQCYQPALERIAEVTVKGNSTIVSPYDEEANTFFGYNSRKAYSSLHTGSRPIPSTLFMEIKESEYVPAIDGSYYPANFSTLGSSHYLNKYSTNKLNIPCEEAATDIKELIEVKLKSIMPERMKLEHQSSSILPKDRNGLQHYTQESEVVNKFIQQAFVDSYTGKRTIYQATPAMAEEENKNFLMKSFNYFWDRITGATEDPTSLGTDMVASIGLAMENPFKAAERVNLYGTLPLYLTVVAGVVFIASPIIIVVSGYKWEVVFNIGFILFYIAMCHFWLNVSYMATNIIWLLSDSFYGGAEILKNSYLTMHYVGYYTPFIVLLVWTVGCTMAGMKLAPFLSGIFAGAAIAAAKAGKNAANQVSAPRAGQGGDKRQF
ncbi:hypothetical protein [Vibrio cyclitrophicus]|uniref:hypothetical protein n=1 Tax=Vibrio cyclitrophicus TaxID=47951 RepID=UPI0032E3F43E